MLRTDAEVLELLATAIESAKQRRFIAVSIDLDVAEQLRAIVEHSQVYQTAVVERSSR